MTEQTDKHVQVGLTFSLRSPSDQIAEDVKRQQTPVHDFSDDGLDTFEVYGID